jgi:micrococcal nuclease
MKKYFIMICLMILTLVSGCSLFAINPAGPIATTPFKVPAQVVRVVDGDTIKVSIDGIIYTVRYIGIDAPESVTPDNPVEMYGLEASAKNQELVDGKIVMLEKDISDTDIYGRLLRYVYVNGLFLNAELVRLGYAQAISYPPDIKYQDELLNLQREAKADGRGLWNIRN